MDPVIWPKVHGAVVHFPLALALASGAADFAAFLLGTRRGASELHVAGRWMMIGGALGSVPAVVSGLMLTRGGVLGHGVLRMHHLFAWPAFALLVALATWRACVGATASRWAFAGYLVATAVTAALISAAGFWGGELLIAR
ncbi:MAG TPA: DUF2231 domain-containing protein [Candidatus Didemnitutus sp.]|nr:DUF2231 domain-containing protein [Candidatus Didemnitutus sp.]